MKIALTLAPLALLLVSCATPPAPVACKPQPSEVVVEELAAGSGQKLGYRTAANVWYTGWLYDGCARDLKGKQFDSNVGTNRPFPLMVGSGKVIKGWDEGLVGMNDKGKRRLIIPPNKGYGSSGSPDGRIPPNATLVFEVEVMNIVYQPTN